MSARRRAGRRVRGGVGRDVLRRVRPDARPALALVAATRRQEKRAAERVIADQPSTVAHEVARQPDGSMRCPCGWTGSMMEAIGHSIRAGTMITQAEDCAGPESEPRRRP